MILILLRHTSYFSVLALPLCNRCYLMAACLILKKMTMVLFGLVSQMKMGTIARGSTNPVFHKGYPRTGRCATCPEHLQSAAFILIALRGKSAFPYHLHRPVIPLLMG
ncbi:Uncharacterised protein [Vibrio cholerae]|nr:Uncharacterised protein [Vibrio cholerae]